MSEPEFATATVDPTRPLTAAEREIRGTPLSPGDVDRLGSAVLVEQPCPAPAELIVFRGRTERLFLCGGHRTRYSGSGLVSPYAVEGTDTSGVVGKVFTGPARRCGETTA